MTDALVHRGPDAHGRYLAPGIGLGVRRLKIIDLITGDQPISNEDGSVITVFNGEIYNFLELRDELARLGHTFRTRSDTEVIVHAYEEFGDDFVSRLRGMFAIALWDIRQRRLVLVRDRLGKKPLVYAHLRGELVFGSELQAIVTCVAVPRTLDDGALGDYLAYGYVGAPATIYSAVRKLPPGHVLVWSEGAVAVSRYWAPRFGPKRQIAEADALEELERRLDEAVRLRLISDVPLGALLSGGVDSSLVVALMAAHIQGPIRTFSIGFEDAGYDELAHARRVARRYGADHHELVVRPDAAAILPDLVRHYGEPYADSSAVPTYYVSKLAKAHVTVALNGDGGDELFGGYDRYRAMLLAERLRSFPASHFLFGLAAAVARGKVGLGTRAGARAERFLRFGALSAPERYASWVGAIPPGQIADLLRPELASRVAAARVVSVERTYAAFADLGPVDRLIATDMGTYLPDDLLVKVDIASMANSLETRSPLLDNEVVEFAGTLPEDLKLRGSQQKYLLRRLARRFVPAENLDRPKMGFGVPVGRWLRGGLKELASEALLGERARSRGYFRSDAVRGLWDQHQSGRMDRSASLWTLLMLELWHQEFVD